MKSSQVREHEVEESHVIATWLLGRDGAVKCTGFHIICIDRQRGGVAGWAVNLA